MDKSMSMKPKPLTIDEAKKVMLKYYKHRRYLSPNARRSAIKRDLCNKKESVPVVNDSRFKHSPRKYDFKGLDDGSLCKGKGKSRSRKNNLRK